VHSARESVASCNVEVLPDAPNWDSGALGGGCRLPAAITLSFATRRGKGPMAKVQKPIAPGLRVRNFFTANPNATNTEAINVTGASQRTVSAVRNQMRSEGEMAPALGVGRPPNRPEGITEDIIPPDEEFRQERDARQEIEAVSDLNLEDMTPEEVRHEMVRLLRSKSTPPPVRVSAAALLEKMRTESGDELGPGDPLTYEDAKVRLTLLMKACGAQLVIECVQEAFNLGGSHGKEEAVDRSDTSSSSSLSSPASNDESLHEGIQGGTDSSI